MCETISLIEWKSVKNSRERKTPNVSILFCVIASVVWSELRKSCRSQELVNLSTVAFK